LVSELLEEAQLGRAEDLDAIGVDQVEVADDVGGLMEMPVVGVDRALRPFRLEPVEPEGLLVGIEERLDRADHRWTPLRAGTLESVGRSVHQCQAAGRNGFQVARILWIWAGLSCFMSESRIC